MMFLFAGYCTAREINIRAGNFEINPSFRITEEYTTNFFSEDNGSIGSGGRVERPDSEATTIYTPGLKIDYPGENLRFELDYKSRIQRHRKFSDEDNEDQDVSLKLELISPAQRLSLILSNHFSDTKDPASIDARTAANLNRADRTKNISRVEIDLKLSELFKLVFDVSYKSDSFDKFDRENTETTQYKSALFYRLTQKTSATLNYTLKSTQYPDAPSFINSNSLLHTVNAGIHVDSTAKLSGIVEFGFTRKRFTQSDFSGENESTFDFEVDLFWDVRERTKLRLGAERAIDEAITGNARSITRNDFALGITQGIYNKFTVNLIGILSYRSYTRDFSGFKRADRAYGTNVGLTYKTQEWLSASIDYEYIDNLSNRNTNEFRVSTWQFNINLLF